MSNYPIWRKPSTPPENEKPIALVTQLAPGPTTTLTRLSYYRDGHYYDVSTGEKIEETAIKWSEIKPGNRHASY